MSASFILFITILTLLLVGVHFLVGKAIFYFWKLHPTFITRLITLGIGVNFILLSVLTGMTYNKILGFLYFISAILLGTVYWLFWASLIAFVLHFILKRLKKTALGLRIGKILLILALFISLYGLIHSYNTKVISYQVNLPNLPAIWEGKKIVLLADTHLGNVRNVRFMKKVVALISEQNPEAVLVAGDFVDGPPTSVKETVSALSRIKTSKGIYFANGNHEIYYEGSDLYEALNEEGIHVLIDELIELDGIQLIGVNFPTTTDEEAQTEVLQKLNIDPNKPSILIKHVPNEIPSAERAGIDLQVSGHSHKGQVWPGPWLTSKVYGIYAYGQQKFNDMSIITTSGAGTWGPPQRVGTDGEIVVITLSKG